MLLEKIRAIETRYAAVISTADACGRESVDRLAETGWRAVDAVLGGGLVDSGLHEWFGVAEEGDGSPSRMNRRGGRWMPPVCVLAHLAWRAMDRSTTPRWAMWIGRSCFPYPRVLVRGESHDARLLDRSVFVAPKTAADRLWAVDLAIRSPATALVIADGSDFNMAATRRLHLAARREHKWILLARPPWEVSVLSAAHTRWRVSRLAGDAPPEAMLLGGDGDSADMSSQAGMNPAWHVQLLRCKGIQLEKVRSEWALEWHRGEGVVDLSAPVACATGGAAAEAPARAVAI